MKIGIIGTGVFSVSVALRLAENKENEIVMWSENESLVDDFKKTKKVESILKEKELPQNITITNGYKEAIEEKDLIFLMTGVSYLEEVCKDIQSFLNKKIPVVIGTKGIAKGEHLFVHQVAKKILKNPISIISGPTFAEDVAALEPVGFTLASTNKETIKKIKSAFQNSEIRIDLAEDLLGVALSGCLKNIYAIGSGIIKGLGYQESTQTLYLNSIYHEMEIILCRYFCDETTLSSLAGFGDLILTCTSSKSRNFTYGEMLSKNKKKKELEEYVEKNTIEGIATLESILPILNKKHIKVPILSTIHDIITGKEDSKKLIKVILNKKDNE